MASSVNPNEAVQKNLQHFELHVLLAMLRQGGETYSVPLVLELEKRTGRSVARRPSSSR